MYQLLYLQNMLPGVTRFQILTTKNLFVTKQKEEL